MRDWFDSEMHPYCDALSFRDRSETSAGDASAPSVNDGPPEVSVVARRFNLSRDLRIETQFQCWAVSDERDLDGPIRVTYSMDAFGEWSEIYTAAIEASDGRETATAHGMGADPYEALARALDSM